ncbi:MAG TPA: hypothetical protein VFQ80_11705, partial [Thermomicrobiales bacterium]|nr:hypothetical protein [Thermomicrobiales bacterium]
MAASTPTNIAIVRGRGAWGVASGARFDVALPHEITNRVVRSCACPAAEFGGSCRTHVARFSLQAGLVGPGRPAPAAPRSRICGNGTGHLTDWRRQ